MIIALPPNQPVDRPVTSLVTCHPLLQDRLPRLVSVMAMRGFATRIIETYRYHARQQWLYGSGRTEEQCAEKGVPLEYARPNLAIVTNAWSAETSAHGLVIQNSAGVWVPASAAVDLCPVGKDGRPFTADDPWDAWIRQCEADANALGLRHIRRANGAIWDKPHLQLVEWSDVRRRLMPSSPPPPRAA